MPKYNKRKSIEERTKLIKNKGLKSNIKLLTVPIKIMANKELNKAKCLNCQLEFNFRPKDIIKESSKFTCPNCNPGTRKRDINFIEKEIHKINKDYKLLTKKYTGSSQKIEIKHDIKGCQHIWYPRVKDLLNNKSRCGICEGGVLFPDERSLKILGQHRRFKYKSNSFFKKSATFICSKHGEFKIGVASFKKNKYGCQKCGNFARSQANRKPYSELKEFCEKAKYELKTTLKNYNDESYWKENNNKIQVKCTIKKHPPYFVDFRNFFHLNSKCPECFNEQKKLGRNEKTVKKILKKLTGIDFKSSHITLNQLKVYKKYRGYFPERQLQIDGYNEEYSVAFEFHGMQHYMYIPYFHKNDPKKYKEQRMRDEMKEDWCRRNKVKLIIIPWSQRSKLENFLKTELKRLNIPLKK